ncbi:MAG: M23 family metallopeptidase [Caldilineales bacterium]|nr:M23 family metallopeptidase [Caldilineales bacterium]
MVWPARGRLTQGFWLPAHPAIDIGAHTGAPVWAADEGVVAEAGWSNYGYGYYVLIRHYDGFSTLYAHLSRIDVSPGEAVGRGQQIGAIGSTGRSTGPHLHLEVRYNGRAYNPLVYLP